MEEHLEGVQGSPHYRLQLEEQLPAEASLAMPIIKAVPALPRGRLVVDLQSI